MAADKAARERNMEPSSAFTTRIPIATRTFPRPIYRIPAPWYSFVVLSIQKGEFHHAIAGCRTSTRPTRRKRS